MREIKFRAKSRNLANEQFPELYEKKTMEFVYGTGFYQDTHNTWLILENPKKETFSQMSTAIVDPETIGRYTGLKDKSGKEIFEGDILDGSYVNPMSQKTIKKHYEVVFRKATFYAELIGKHPYGTSSLYFENEKCIIIGNTTDSADLLEFARSAPDPTESTKRSEAEGGS